MSTTSAASTPQVSPMYRGQSVAFITSRRLHTLHVGGFITDHSLVRFNFTIRAQKPTNATQSVSC